jgi:glycosidase
LAGAPVIYYGTEVGLSQYNDVMQKGFAIHEETRLPMLWGDDQDKELFEYYKKLVQIRKDESALTHGTRETILATEKVIAYRRANEDNSVVCLMNVSEEESEMELDIPESNILLVTSSGSRIQADGSLKRIFLPPFGGIILK